MSDFIINAITDSGTVNFPKTDRFAPPAGVDPTKIMSGSEWNSICQALFDTRKNVLSGSIFGFGNRYTYASVPTIPSHEKVTGDYLFVSSSGELVFHTKDDTNRVLATGSSGGISGAGSNGAIAFWTGASTLGQDPTQLFWDNTNNRLGIGTASPNVTLDIAGTVGTTVSSGQNAASYSNGVDSTMAVVPVGSGQMRLKTDFSGRWMSFAPGGGSTDMLSVKEAGVGIGTTNQTYRLEVKDGTAGFAFNATTQAIGTTFGTGGELTIYADSPGAGTGPKIFLGGSGRGDAQKNATVFSISGFEKVRIDGDYAGHNLGYIGIGTSTPVSPVHVYGSADGLLYLDSQDTSGNNSSLTVRNVGTSFGHPFVKFIRGSTEVGAVNGNTTETSGMVDGITLAAVSGKEVGFRVGSTSVGRFKANGDFLVDTNTFYVDAPNNRVGIGTSSPSAQFHIQGTNSLVWDGNTLTIDNVNTTRSVTNLAIKSTAGDDPLPNISFLNGSTVLGSIEGWNETDQYGMVRGINVSIHNSAHVFGIRSVDGITLTQRAGFKHNGDFYVDPAANVFYVDAVNNMVGIGTATPAFKLTVSGTIATDTGYRFPDGTTQTTAATVDGVGSGNAVAYWSDSNTLAAEPTQLYWDDINNRLGIGTSSPTAQLHVAASSVFGGPNTYSGQTSITAFAGGGQGSATDLTVEINFVTTVASAGDSVKLPAVALGKHVVVVNDGANAVDIFPNSGHQIDSLGANVAYSLAAGNIRTFWGKNTTDWRSN